MSGRFYRNRRRYYRRRYYRRNYNYGRTVRKAYGNMRAAKQQADQATFTINIPSTISCFLKTNTNDPITGNEDPTNMKGVYAMNMFDQLRKSSFFTSYANMYDEFKIDRIKVKLLPSSFTYTATAGVAADGGRYKNITIYTAWDRTGLNADQLILNISGLDSLDDPEKLGTKDDTIGLYTSIGTNITTYSSAESRIINPGANTSITRWLNPKTMMEKSQWVSTSQLRQWYEQYDGDNGRWYGLSTGIPEGGSTSIIDGNFVIDNNIESAVADATTTVSDTLNIRRLGAVNSENPCFLLEDPSVKFKPTLLVSCYPPVPANKDNKCEFNVETEIVCTFRGLRKAKVVAA